MLLQSVADHTGVDLSNFPSHQLDVRGRSEDITDRVIMNAKDLPVKSAVRKKNEIQQYLF